MLNYFVGYIITTIEVFIVYTYTTPAGLFRYIVRTYIRAYARHAMRFHMFPRHNSVVRWLDHGASPLFEADVTEVHNLLNSSLMRPCAYCVGTDEVLVRYWSGTDEVLMRYWCGPGELLMRYWWGTDEVLMKYWWCTDEVLMRYVMMCWWGDVSNSSVTHQICTDEVLMRYWLGTDVRHWWCTDVVLVRYWWGTYEVLRRYWCGIDEVLMKYWWGAVRTSSVTHQYRTDEVLMRYL